MLLMRLPLARQRARAEEPGRAADGPALGTKRRSGLDDLPQEIRRYVDDSGAGPAAPRVNPAETLFRQIVEERQSFWTVGLHAVHVAGSDARHAAGAGGPRTAADVGQLPRPASSSSTWRRRLQALPELPPEAPVPHAVPAVPRSRACRIASGSPNGRPSGRRHGFSRPMKTVGGLMSKSANGRCEDTEVLPSSQSDIRHSGCVFQHPVQVDCRGAQDVYEGPPADRFDQVGRADAARLFLQHRIVESRNTTTCASGRTSRARMASCRPLKAPRRTSVITMSGRTVAMCCLASSKTLLEATWNPHSARYRLSGSSSARRRRRR